MHLACFFTSFTLFPSLFLYLPPRSTRFPHVYCLAAANPRLSNFQGHFPPSSTSLELPPLAPRSVGRSRCHLQTSSVRIPVQHRPSACPSPRWTKTELRADALCPAPLRHTRLPLQTSYYTAAAPLPPPSHMLKAQCNSLSSPLLKAAEPFLPLGHGHV